METRHAAPIDTASPNTGQRLNGIEMKMLTARRQCRRTFGPALAAVGTIAAAAEDTEIGPCAHTVEALTKRLAALPRWRDFRTEPVILDHRDQWDGEALDAVLRCAGGPTQCWNHTDHHGPWLNVTQNAMNTDIRAFKYPGFLTVSGTMLMPGAVGTLADLAKPGCVHTR